MAMRFLALAADYDGTLAHDGRVDEATLDALRRFNESGRKLLMVTGRELEDLKRVFSHLDLFRLVVAENGALLYDPHSQSERVLAPAPPPAFCEELKRRNVPIGPGKSIVATNHPHETTVLEVIREMGLELQVIFNKGSVMVLPSGINKGSGMQVALKEMGLSAHNVIGVGDAENDHAFLSTCECSVAVANALDSVKERCDLVMESPRGAGVVELVRRVLKDDLESAREQLKRHSILLGENEQGEKVGIEPYGPSVLISGPSGSGKSSALTGMLERINEAGYQFCLIDPEGDYEDFEGAVNTGDAERPPSVKEVLAMLDTFQNVVVNLLGIPLNDRPGFFAQLLPQLQERRAQFGRPHWLVVDEAHHLLPDSWQPAPVAIPQQLYSTVFVTVHPDHVSRAALRTVGAVLAIGAEPGKTLKDFAERADIELPGDGGEVKLEKGQALAWLREGERPFVLNVEPGKIDRRRHRRKYAEGDIKEKSFVFRGPQGKLNLRAQNLAIFIQMAQGVDEDTWQHHLQQHDYSTWIREAIKDKHLAEEVEQIENEKLAAKESRDQVIAAIEKQYTSAA
jgi:hydroxymethylpyrimidine pyrophosphatase-like HAD family hydrolase